MWGAFPAMGDSKFQPAPFVVVIRDPWGRAGVSLEWGEGECNDGNGGSLADWNRASFPRVGGRDRLGPTQG